METIQLGNTDIAASRIGLGTWAIGGWMWGGSDEQQAIATIQSAIDRGITMIDTAPVYGFGRSEEIVGKTIAEGRLRSRSLGGIEVPGQETLVSHTPLNCAALAVAGDELYCANDNEIDAIAY